MHAGPVPQFTVSSGATGAYVGSAVRSCTTSEVGVTVSPPSLGQVASNGHLTTFQGLGEQTNSPQST